MIVEIQINSLLHLFIAHRLPRERMDARKKARR